MTPIATHAPFVVQPGTLSGKTVVVDPGHGGADPGAVHRGLREADVNLAIALELRPILQAAGARAVLTRTGNNPVAPSGSATDEDLQARVNVANAAGGHLFISIHSNAHADADKSGVMTFFGPERGYAYEDVRTPRLVARSRQLASAVQRELTAATSEADRGLRQAAFWVLGQPRMPAALVETGFLTNARDAALLGNPFFRRRVAQGIYSGVVAFFATEDDAEFVADVNVRDGSLVTPGAPFTKTWRLRNTGATTWTGSYRLAFHSGDLLGGPSWVSLPMDKVSPGAEVDVSVPLVAPPRDGGRILEGQWQLENAAGHSFGDRIWVAVRPRLPLPTDRVERIDHPELTYSDVTGHNVGFGFRRFYEGRGGLDRFGYPRTEELQEDGRTVQYFQRARFEYHPEHAGTPYEVQLGLVGDILTTGRRPFPGALPFPADPQHEFLSETGHGVHFAFLTYFRERGGLDIFGYPISEEMREGSEDDPGRLLTVQYFQRARFEYHPEHSGTPYEVQLGLLGDQWLRQKGWLS